MKTSLFRPLAVVLALGAVSLANARAAAPAHLTTALALSAEIRAQGESGVFTNASGVALNRYGGSWSGSDASFYTLAGSAADGLPMNYTKCAPLISRLLRNTSNFRWNNWTFKDPVLGFSVTTASPFPYQMIAMMEQGRGFATSFTDLQLAEPGDIICLSRTSNPTDDHAMLFVEADWDSAVEYPADVPHSDPALAGALFVPILIVDSTSTNPAVASGGLHASDSRRFVLPDGSVRFTPGVGTGVMGVLVDGDGEILGHTWSLPTDGDPESDDAGEVDAWVEDLNDRLEVQTGTDAREMVIGRAAL